MAVRYTVSAQRQVKAQGCSVSVYEAGGTTLATIYANEQGDAKANPFVWSGVEDLPTFYAAVGDYYVTIEGGALPTNQKYEVGNDVGEILLADGTAAAPSLSFASDPDTGLYSPTANQIGFSVAGVVAGSLNASYQTAPALYLDQANQDVRLTREAANVVALTNASNAAKTKIGQASAVSTALTSGSTYTFTNLIPAGSIVLGVTVRVNTLITGATSISIGDGTDADRWGAGIAVAAGTTTSLADATITSVPIYAAATSVVLTAAGSDFTAGVVRAVVYYISLVAPTS